MHSAAEETGTDCSKADAAGVQIRLLMLLLNSEQWRYFPLTVQVLSTDFSKLLHGVDSPPDHVGILYGPAEVRHLLLMLGHPWLLPLSLYSTDDGPEMACVVATLRWQQACMQCFA